jgi:hypothetical protein
MKATEHSAGALQTESEADTNKENTLMSNRHTDSQSDEENYFPEVVLKWDFHKSLVSYPDTVSEVLIIVSKNGELTTSKFITVDEHTFKWHRTMSNKVARALLGVAPDTTLKNKKGTKGSLITMLKRNAIMAGGVYLLENRYAASTQEAVC